MAIDNTMGAFLLGVIFAMALWGTGSIQMYYYFNNYPSDGRLLKIFVVIIWLLDTAHQGLIIKIVYSYLISDFGNPFLLFDVDPCLWAMLVISGVVCLLVQGFLVYRAWILSHKNIVITASLALLVLGEFAAVLVYLITGVQYKTYAGLPRVAPASRAINAFGATSDLAIAAVLIYYLHSARSKTGFRRTESVLTRLIIFVVSTGALTSACALMSLLLVSLYPETFLYIAFFVCVSRLYTNTLFATLNARPKTSGGPTLSLSSFSAPSNGSARMPSFPQFLSAARMNADDPENGTQLVSIKVDREMRLDVDENSVGPVDSKDDTFK